MTILFIVLLVIALLVLTLCIIFGLTEDMMWLIWLGVVIAIALIAVGIVLLCVVRQSRFRKYLQQREVDLNAELVKCNMNRY